MSPSPSRQGAGQAIEDAVELDGCLAAHSDIHGALEAYAAARVTRANKIVTASRQFGRIAQWSHPVAVAVRSLAMRLTPRSVTISQARKLMSEV